VLSSSLSNNDYTISILNSTFQSLHCTDCSGSALFISNIFSVTLDNSTLIQNTCSHNGGAIYISSSALVLTNTTIDNNAADLYGGGIYSELSKISLFSGTSSRITNNAALIGGGIRYLASDESTQLPIDLINIVKDNTALLYGNNTAMMPRKLVVE